MIAREARHTVKVILNGTGGDELFGGYPRYNVRGLLPLRAAQALGGALGRRGSEYPLVGRAAAALDYRERYLRRLTYFREGAVRHALELDSTLPVTDRIRNLFASVHRSDPAAAMMYVDLHEYLPGDLFMLLDKMTMAASLEARVPLLDHRLVEFSARIPGDLKMRGHKLKWLLREALRGHLPDQLLDRPKQGFGPPVTAWLAGNSGHAAVSLLLERRSGSRDVLPPRVLREWLAPMIDTSARSNTLWALLILELWQRIFLEGEAVDALEEVFDNLASFAA
jgi:asparagine synthase (glutamine-hydrolysing)